VSGDETIAQELRGAGVPIVLAVNKTDDKRALGNAADFYPLGIEPVTEISAEHGTGVGELLDEIISGLGSKAADVEAAVASPLSPDQAARETTVAIVGRPNVGKSSLLNRLLREERVLVSDLPGTTRDAIDALVTWHRRRFRIVDTAGMRRPGRVQDGGRVELVSVSTTRKAIGEADVVALVVDSEEGATDQDAAIGGEADRAGKGIVVVANKWDRVKVADPEFVKTFDANLRRRMKFLDYAPVLHVSALTAERISSVLETIDQVATARRQRIPTPALNKFIETIVARNPPVSPQRRHVRILYAAQIGVAPPAFVFFTNVATTFHFSYERFLINQLRDQFGFVGSPIRLEVRRRAA
jgi:GTP-binding protein